MKTYNVLIADLVGLKFAADGQPDPSEVAAHIDASGGVFYPRALQEGEDLSGGDIHFFYQPDLSREDELLAAAGDGQYDAVIAAATFFPAGCVFAEGGVRIGAGTGNMGSASWGGGSGQGGTAPLMNTPSFNSRATSQMVLKALFSVLPDLPVEDMHQRVLAGDFDTGKHLRDYPTEKLEGKRLAVIGYGNIGRDVALLGKALGMNVAVHARERHQDWIESEGFEYAPTIIDAARGADVLSPHTGLGAPDASGKFANEGLIGAEALNVLNDGAVLINYDRGEVVNAAALEQALQSGKVRHACIDADLFVDPDSGALSGPMVPYREIAERMPDKLSLLPHAAADTEHTSRVAGAKQAVDQIIQAIRERRVVNCVGTLPEGYSNGGALTVNGVGAVSPAALNSVAQRSDLVAKYAELSAEIAEIWQAVAAEGNDAKREALMISHGERLVLLQNRLQTLINQHGITGPYKA